jgi:predicted DCC family thiol-disulfide oxidoreductase YuxK
VRSEAALRTVAALGGGWRLVALARVVPRAVRDAAYDVVARSRHRWFGRRVACRVPSPAERARFVDG